MEKVVIKKGTEYKIYIILCSICMYLAMINDDDPGKNVTRISSCHFDGSLVENDPKSDENPIIFLENAMEIPLLALIQPPCHV